MDDIFAGNKKAYSPFGGDYTGEVDLELQLDPATNSPESVRRRYIQNVVVLCKRYPLLLFTMRVSLPIQPGICNDID